MILSLIDGEATELHKLTSSEIIVISSDIIFSRVASTLHLDDHEWFYTRIGKTMKMPERNMASFIGPEHADLFDFLKCRMTDIDGCNT